MPETQPSPPPPQGQPTPTVVRAQPLRPDLRPHPQIPLLQEGARGRPIPATTFPNWRDSNPPSHAGGCPKPSHPRRPDVIPHPPSSPKRDRTQESLLLQEGARGRPIPATTFPHWRVSNPSPQPRQNPATRPTTNSPSASLSTTVPSVKRSQIRPSSPF